MIYAAVLGYGNIGSGVAQVLRENADVILAKVGQEIQVKYVLDLREFPGDPMEKQVVHDADIILNDPEIAIVVETMGGVHPAYDFVKKALENGKSVATSNKELVAACGAELFETAKEKGVSFLFEASVGGGIPIIRPLMTCITGDHVQSISGILNGTTNYMLQRMSEGLSFDDALAEAQRLGFAERNPSADVEGKDAERKIAILSSMMSGANVDWEQVPTEGIVNLTEEDMQYAAALGCVVKLLAQGRMTADGLQARVAPTLLPKDHPLASVNGVINGVLVNGDMVGDLLFTGAGAGKLPTASAVVADVVDAAKHLNANVYEGWSKESAVMADPAKDAGCFLVRFTETDAETAKKLAEEAGGELLTGVVSGEFAIQTGIMTEEAFAEFAEKNHAKGSLRFVRS